MYRQLPSSLLAVGSKLSAFGSVQPSGTGIFTCCAALPVPEIHKSLGQLFKYYFFFFFKLLVLGVRTGPAGDDDLVKEKVELLSRRRPPHA